VKGDTRAFIPSKRRGETREGIPSHISYIQRKWGKKKKERRGLAIVNKKEVGGEE